MGVSIVLLNGTNSANQHGLWVSDGTAAGTHELTGISGANSGGALQLVPRWLQSRLYKLQRRGAVPG